MTFQMNSFIMILYCHFITLRLSVTDRGSIICKVTIKASGLIWGSGPPLLTSLTIVLNPLKLQRNVHSSGIVLEARVHITAFTAYETLQSCS